MTWEEMAELGSSHKIP